MAKPFVKDDPRINRKGRPKIGQSIAELAREFMKGETTVVRKDANGNEAKAEKVGRTMLFLEALYNRATVGGSDSAAKLLWNYLDGLPPFTGRLGALPPEDGAEIDPADEEAIKEHLRELIMGKAHGKNGNGNGSQK